MIAVRRTRPNAASERRSVGASSEHPNGITGAFGLALTPRVASDRSVSRRVAGSKRRAVDFGVGPTPDDERPSWIWPLTAGSTLTVGDWRTRLRAGVPGRAVGALSPLFADTRVGVVWFTVCRDRCQHGAGDRVCRAQCGPGTPGGIRRRRRSARRCPGSPRCRPPLRRRRRCCRRHWPAPRAGRPGSRGSTLAGSR